MSAPSARSAEKQAAYLLLADLLRQEHVTIVARWLVAIRECPPTRETRAPPVPSDGAHRPALVEWLAVAAQALAAGQWRDVQGQEALRRALRHLGPELDLEQLVAELFLLRHVLLGLLWARQAPARVRLHEPSDLGWAVDSAIRLAVELATIIGYGALPTATEAPSSLAAPGEPPGATALPAEREGPPPAAVSCEAADGNEDHRSADGELDGAPRSEVPERHRLDIVSHDMRTPLATIKLSAELLLRDESLAACHAKTVARIFANAARLERLLAELSELPPGALGDRPPRAR